MLRPIAFMALLVILGGCSAEPSSKETLSPTEAASSGPTEEPGAALQDVSLRIRPSVIRKGTAVQLVAEGFPMDGAEVHWLVNGQVAGPTLDGATLGKGDTIQARAVGAFGTVSSDVTTVRNAPPEVRVLTFLPNSGKPGDSIGVNVEGYDADGDPIRFDIAWTCNGKAAGMGNRLEVPVKRGDEVTVTVTPFDGEERGQSVTLNREIRNTPPVILGQEQFRVEGDTVSFHVRASDPDGDTLTYALRESPPGVRIDAATGTVRWDAPAGTQGKIPFVVAVSDGAGGETTARFVVTVREDTAPNAQ